MAEAVKFGGADVLAVADDSGVPDALHAAARMGYVVERQWLW